MGIRAEVASLALLAALMDSGAARAELYRCVGPDGSVSFTDNAGACGNARAHQPADVIQRVPPAPPPAAPRRIPGDAALRQQAEADAERSWREKKLQSERERAAVTRSRDHLREYAALCNRGGELYRRDESGLKQKVPCSHVNREMEGLERRLAELDAYLEQGLAEECRRAGCLPGWIR